MRVTQGHPSWVPRIARFMHAPYRPRGLISPQSTNPSLMRTLLPPSLPSPPGPCPAPPPTDAAPATDDGGAPPARPAATASTTDAVSPVATEAVIAAPAPTPAAEAATVVPVALGTGMDLGGDEGDEVDPDDPDDLPEPEPDVVLTVEDCLFCTHRSESLVENLKHMNLAHGFYIPDVEYDRFFPFFFFLFFFFPSSFFIFGETADRCSRVSPQPHAASAHVVSVWCCIYFWVCFIGGVGGLGVVFFFSLLTLDCNLILCPIRLRYLVDLSGMVRYLGDKVSRYHICLLCNGRGKAFHSTEAVRNHMCTANFDILGDHFSRVSALYATPARAARCTLCHPRTCRAAHSTWRARAYGLRIGC